MFERFTSDARTAVAQAQDHARRLGHPFIGSEHLLLALVGGQSPAADALRSQLVTPERVEEQIVRLIGLGGRAAASAELDREALAAIGIDLDRVSAAIDATFGAEALARVAPGHRRSSRRRCGRRPGLRRRWRRWRSRHRSPGRRRVPEGARLTAPPATGRYQAAGSPPAGHLPFTPRAKRVLERSVLESRARHDQYIAAQHLALALVTSTDGVLPRVLAALAVSPPTLTMAINDRYRRAS